MLVLPTCGCKALIGELLLLDGESHLLGPTTAVWCGHGVNVGALEPVLIWPAGEGGGSEVCVWKGRLKRVDNCEGGDGR